MTAAINSVRGEAAGAIAALLFADADRIGPLRSAVVALVRDPTLTVRSVAALPLLAILRSEERESLELFTALCADADPILGTGYFERYLNHAVYRSYEAVRPILLRMLASQEAEVRRAAARQVCLAALHDGPSREAAIEDAARVAEGDPEMRTGAAEVYARNCGHADVAAQCIGKLPRFFDDPAVEVRREAARSFGDIEADQLRGHDALIEAFSTSAAFADNPFPLLRRLDDMSGPVPGSVCYLADRAIDAWGAAAGDIQTSSSHHASILAKLIVRLYAQASDDAQRKRALDAIDRMLDLRLRWAPGRTQGRGSRLAAGGDNDRGASGVAQTGRVGGRDDDPASSCRRSGGRVRLTGASVCTIAICSGSSIRVERIRANALPT